MNKPPSEYDEIKLLVESQNNSITNIQNNINNSKKYCFNINSPKKD